MALIKAATIAASIAARFPQLGDEPGTVDTLAAQGETIDKIEAQALRSYTQPSGSFVFVRATEAHFVAGNYVEVGDIVQVTEGDATVLKGLGRATDATDAEVAAAQTASKGK